MKRADALGAKELIEHGATVIDVLPANVYQEEHLPGARSIPLDTFKAADVESLDRQATLLVYCFDQH